MNLNINDPNFDKGKLDAYNKQDYQNIEDNINYAYGYVMISAKYHFSTGIIDHTLVNLLPIEVQTYYRLVNSPHLIDE